MSLINLSNLTFAYEGSDDTIFHQVSLRMDSTWKLGLVGRNGKGKTTLLKLLMGEYPYSGTISSDGNFAYFPMEIKEDTWMAMELIPEGVPLWKVQRELSLMGTEEELLYRPIQTLSGGEKTRVMLAVLFARENCFLLIDEPTDHLDIQARRQVGAYLNKKQGFILVSHDRTLLDACTDHILAINRATIEIQKGNFSSWYENRQKRDAYERDEHKKQVREINKLEKAARQTAGWSDKIEKTKKGHKVSGLKPDKGYIGHQAAKMMKRSKAAESRKDKAIQKKKTLLIDVEKIFSLKLEPLQYHTQSLITMNDLAIYYQDQPVCGPVTAQICQGERILLTGPNGSGKTSILKLITGEPLDYTGELHIGSRLMISYVPQETGLLTGTLREYARMWKIDESRFKAILNKMDFSKEQFDKPMEVFSRGQKKKVMLARSLCQSAHLYIWDEPFNYIDLFSRMQIEELILAAQPTMLLVEHDLAFIEKAATGTIALGR
ncbi:ABC-F type ribosomal protection protein [Ihubacter massiliensis]|uniref:ABC-F type ribosomal protection protein n=1 Tax=Hominibacterium faecale TaxID=2839743 RepID=A0A9J6QU53_9FIRM|nr:MULTISPECIES: ABC-F type ribosomal protection protein [Eubacteriales Family XIII. Incertae Sedis]MCO7122845.1 ABC-F type ribosomal protection protein [Ihubacter massiliensis]MCU7377118.1 ABC-F type ribosomal protection protein [Hominibacterium faecale]